MIPLWKQSSWHIKAPTQKICEYEILRKMRTSAHADFRLADLTDLDLFQQELDSTLFPGLSSDIKVHGGFADEHARYGIYFINDKSPIKHMY